MNSFERNIDFEYALGLARQNHPNIDYRDASRSASGWTEEEICIRDRSNNTLCSFDSSTYLLYLSKTGRSAAASVSRSERGRALLDSGGMDVTPAAARNARSMVTTIKSVSYICSTIIAVSGLILAVRLGSFQGLLGLMVLVAAFAIALISHWLIKLTCVGLEILADISEDLKSIRLAKPDDETYF
jgi:hypothetical protein